MAVGYGRQILLSAVTAGLVSEQLPENTTVKDLGEHRLKELSNAEHLSGSWLHRGCQAGFLRSRASPPCPTICRCN
jgi:hypothetical protein